MRATGSEGRITVENHARILNGAWAAASLCGMALVLAPSAQASGQNAGEVFQDCEACPMMIVLPAGTYLMGSPVSESAVSGEGTPGYERPQHRVTIPGPFAVGVYEVAFAEWDVCVQAGGCEGYRPVDEGWGRGWHPVINVNWDDAQAYVLWLSAETGESYRLLSEAEWEYAARAGTETRWYWGDDASVQCRYANGRDQDAEADLPPSRNPYLKFPDCRDGHVHTAPLGSFQPNPFGLFDMLGNVAEWTEDCWRSGHRSGTDTAADFNAYDGAPDNGSAWVEGSCTVRVRRGGSWRDPPELMRSAARLGMDARADPLSRRHTDRSSAVGFRVARDLLRVSVRVQQDRRPE